MLKTNFLILTESEILPNMIRAINRGAYLVKFTFLSISENEFFQEIKCDGITSLHGIHVYDYIEFLKKLFVYII